MELYQNKEALIDAIQATSNSLKIVPSLIEKDYFVTLILRRLNQTIPGLLFKGGTCCSKAYKVINRFSEDIDLSLDINHFSRANARLANKAVISVCDELGFRIINREKVEKHSHGSYNCYYVEYPIIYPSVGIKPYVQIEMVFMSKSYPSETKTVNSFIGDLVFSRNKEIAEKYNLLPFAIIVQSLDRTFVDKVFAVCDYYLKNEAFRNSRHIYDLFQIGKQIELNESLLPLIQDVRGMRIKNKHCPSAKDGNSVSQNLIDIVSSHYFEKDYNEVTYNLLITKVDYDTIISILLNVAQSKLFN